MEIITKKRMMLYSGTIHPVLAHEIADNLGIRLCLAALLVMPSAFVFLLPIFALLGAPSDAVLGAPRRRLRDQPAGNRNAPCGRIARQAAVDVRYGADVPSRP